MRPVALLGLSVLVASAVAAQAPKVHHIHGVAIDRQDPQILYVATHTGLVRIRPGAAPDWIGTHRFDLMGFTPDPRASHVFYASGHPDLITYQRDRVGNLGLLVSENGGRTWRSVALAGQADFHALTYSSRSGGVLYGWSVAGQIGLFRIVRSTWRAERVPARGLSDVLSLAASPEADGPLLAGTKTGLLLSRDGGIEWAPVTAVPHDVAVTAVAYHASEPRVIFASLMPAGLRRSENGGSTWETTSFPASPTAAIVALAAGPGAYAAAATGDSDVLISRDGGRTWQRVLDRARPHGAR